MDVHLLLGELPQGLRGRPRPQLQHRRGRATGRSAGQRLHAGEGEPAFQPHRRDRRRERPVQSTGRGLGEGRPPDRQLAEPLHRRGGSRHLHLPGRALRQAGWKVPETGRREAHRRRREGGGENAGQADRQAAGEETRHHADAKRTEAAGKERPPPPPPKAWEALTEKERQGVLDCLCRCNSSATSSVAVGYDPKPSNASPSCAKAANGPCINQGFGCWRHFPDGGTDCAKGCYKRYNATGAPAGVLNAGKDGK